MELIRCDLCGKEIKKKAGNKVNINYGDRHLIFAGNDVFEMDLCAGCTNELTKKVKENRKKVEKVDLQIIDEMHEYGTRSQQDNE